MSVFLLSCGDVESNPGPDTPEKIEKSGEAEPVPQGSSIQGMYQCIRDSIREAMKDAARELKEQQIIENEKMRARQEEQTERLENRMLEMSDALFSQLGLVENNQTQIKDNVNILKLQYASLLEENEGLQKQINLLKNKCDSLENHSRRNNLLFFGIKKEQGKEDWDSCEQKVKTVIREGMGIEEEIAIERAHRTGRGEAIIVKFLSYKCKTLILKNARKLKTSDKFQRVFVREDFSEIVRRKRQGLRDKARQLYDAGQKTRMKFDTLVTEDGVYTYDIEREVVIRVNTERVVEEEVENPEEKTRNPNRNMAQGTSGQSAQQMEWDLCTDGRAEEIFPPLQTQSNNGDNALPYILPMAEFPNMNQSKNRRTTEQIGTGQRSPQDDTRTARRHSITDVPTRSPVKTRQRASSSSLKDRLAEKDTRTNTLHQWMMSSNTKHQARGGRGGRVGIRMGRGGAAVNSGEGGGRGSGGARGKCDDGDKPKR